jgi:hypothetical protein
MMAWSPESVAALQWSAMGVAQDGPMLYAGVKFYRHHTRHDVVWATCWACNGDDYIPDGYMPMDVAQVHRWLETKV